MEKGYLTKNKHFIIFIAIIAVSLILRILFAINTPGDEYDLGLHKSWGKIILENGIINAYEKTDIAENYNGLNHPPLWLYSLASIAYFEKFFFNSNLSTFSLKIPAITADIALGIIIFLIASKLFNKNIGLISSAFYLFSPGIFYESAVWGQWDSLYIPFVVLAIYFISKDKPIISTIFITVGFLIKLQAIIFFPAILFLIYKKYDIKKFIKVTAGSLVTIIVATLPFIISGKLFTVFEKTWQQSNNLYPFTTIFASNIWQMNVLIEGSLINDKNLILNIISYKNLGLILFSLAYIFILYFLNKKSEVQNIWLAFAFIAFSFFMLPTEIHERYLFPIFGILSIIWIKNKRLWPAYIVLTITFFFNLLAYLPFPNPYSPLINFSGYHIYLTLTNIFIFIYMFMILLSYVRNKEFIKIFFIKVKKIIL